MPTDENNDDRDTMSTADVEPIDPDRDDDDLDADLDDDELDADDEVTTVGNRDRAPIGDDAAKGDEGIDDDRADDVHDADDLEPM